MRVIVLSSWMFALAACDAPIGPVTARAGWSVVYHRGEVVLATGDGPASEVGLALRAWGPEGALREAEGVDPRGDLSWRTEYPRPGLVEWWERGPAGLEHGFTIDEPPRTGDLVIELALRGAVAEVEPDGRSATLRVTDDLGLRYEGLAAWDARGVALAARMEPTPGGLLLVVDAEDAVGPVTVDPLIPGATWAASGPVAGADFGRSVASAGDVNGDGWDDVVIGAPSFDNGQSNEGGAFLYLGGPAGLAALPAWSLESDQTGAALGTSVASAGDVNGDGYDDVLVGAPYGDGMVVNSGSVRLFLGAAAGLVGAPALTLTSDQAGSQFGASVASAGDLNGDGYDDVVVGAPMYDGVEVDGGAAFVYFGSPAGLGAVAGWQTEHDLYGAWLGTSVAGAGDVDGDGYDDLVIGVPRYAGDLTAEGAAFVYLGSASGPGAVAWRAEGDQFSAQIGNAVASAGDVNGDGFDDVLVGAQHYETDDLSEGAAFLFLGGAAGLAPTWAWRTPALGGGLVNGIGVSVASAGDVNADGFDDVVVGAHMFTGDPTEQNEGAALVHLGWAGGVRAEPAFTIEGDQNQARLGISVASAGDVQGDGYADLIVGAHMYSVMGYPPYSYGWASREGVAFVFTGRPLADTDRDGVYDVQDVCVAASDPAQLDDDGDGLGNACDRPALEALELATPGGELSLVATGVVPGETVRFGAVAGPPGVGPCPAALGGACLELGAAAVAVGTAVADALGVATLPVLVPGIPAPNGTFTVQAAIVRGVGGGASVTSLPLVLDGDDGDWDGDGLSDAEELGFGTDPTRADTDGDGLEDGAEIAPWLDPLDADADGDGVPDQDDVCLPGADNVDLDADGLADACDVCPADVDPIQADADADRLGDACEGDVLVGPTWSLDGDDAFGSLGLAVAAAGDVDGDGYADVVVSAPWLSRGEANEGLVAVHLGSAGGLSPIAVWEVESDWAGASFGDSVAGVGDANGDGFGDLVVGAPAFTSGFGEEGEGAVLLYLGSPSGPELLPAWRRESNVADTRLGSAVAAAGDVNGDGFADVLVAADYYDGAEREEGAAMLFLGSAAGLGARPSWSVAGGRVNAALGTALAGAGDVNGDGYDDVVVALDVLDAEGEVRVYLGSPAGLGATPSWTAVGGTFGDLGRSVAGAGDVNGDGYDDLLVGDSYFTDSQAQQGAAFLWLGSPRGLEATPSWTGTPNQSTTRFGCAVAGAGDVNGDGFDDVVVGAEAYDSSVALFDEGAAFVYLGSPLGLGATAATVLSGSQSYALFGAAVAGAGDTNGDGRSEVIVGSPQHDPPGLTDGGAARLYSGVAP